MSGLTLPFAADVSMRSYALIHYRYWHELDWFSMREHKVRPGQHVIAARQAGKLTSGLGWADSRGDPDAAASDAFTRAVCRRGELRKDSMPGAVL
jgi:hypothetical protein